MEGLAVDAVGFDEAGERAVERHDRHARPPLPADESDVQPDPVPSPSRRCVAAVRLVDEDQLPGLVPPDDVDVHCAGEGVTLDAGPGADLVRDAEVPEVTSQGRGRDPVAGGLVDHVLELVEVEGWGAHDQGEDDDRVLVVGPASTFLPLKRVGVIEVDGACLIVERGPSLDATLWEHRDAEQVRDLGEAAASAVHTDDGETEL